LTLQDVAFDEGLIQPGYGPDLKNEGEAIPLTATRKLPDHATLRRMRSQGFTQRDIAQTYGVTESAVWKALNRAGYTETVVTYKDILPWDIAEAHKATAIMERFRSIVKQQKGAPLRPDEEALLKRWLRDLEANELVVNYHPDAPANSACTKGGFYYVPKDADDDWIIRRPTPR
jgi:transcriptional regulator with XRE-family HTH domain